MGKSISVFSQPDFMLRLILLAFLVCLHVLVLAQQPALPGTVADNQEIGQTVKEILKILSGEKGQLRDWGLFRQYFRPEARLTAVFHKQDGTKNIKTLSLEEFIKLTEENARASAFYEFEIGKTILEYNGIAHVFQAYKAQSGNFEEEGINSIQLVQDNGKWLILNILWVSNRNGKPIPKEFK
jgi:hypothetical protein